MNTWPGGNRKALDQAEHERWNTCNYPGTLQLCSVCSVPTGRCEEDSLSDNNGNPLCEEHYNIHKYMDEEENRSSCTTCH